jgi:hypothetical protein
LAAVIDIPSRGALGLFQPFLHSCDAEAFIEGGYPSDFFPKETVAHLKHPDCDLALPPGFLVRDVLLVVPLNRKAEQATCGACYVVYGDMVQYF